MTVPAIRTLGDLLAATGHRFQVFDLGRRIVPLGRGPFARFEAGELPYPQPLQRQAWLGLLGWRRQGAPLVWFLRLPLDELGLLALAGRDDFLHQLLEQIGEVIGSEQPLPVAGNSAYGFKPRQEAMAVFHAKALAALKQPPSHWYAAARRYFGGEADWVSGWQGLGLQGIADLAARLGTEGNAERIAAALPHLPAEPLRALAHCLEHEAIPAALARPLAARAEAALAADDLEGAVAALRGLSHSRAVALRRDALAAALAHPLGGRPELLAALAARAWETVSAPPLCRPFVERLAAAGQEVFDAVMGDLLFLPGLREPLLAELRDPGRSAAVTAATEGLFGRG